MRFAFPFQTLLLQIGLCAIPSQALSLQGKVIDPSGNVLPGVGVSLVLSGISTTSDDLGKWSLTAASGLSARTGHRAALSPNLSLQDGRIHLRFDGIDAAGRGLPSKPASAPGPGAARSAEVVDTLHFTWNGNVLLRVKVTSLVDGFLGNQVVDTNAIPWNVNVVYGSIYDIRDGRVYKSLKIGSQDWMAENLNYQADSSWCLENSLDSCAKYGRLYTWASALALHDSCNESYSSEQVEHKRQGICPNGWHVPTDSEWSLLLDTTLAAYPYYSVGRLLGATAGWNDIFRSHTDSLGFRILPSGEFSSDHDKFYSDGDQAYFWTATENGEFGGVCYSALVSMVTRQAIFKSAGFSLRCVGD